MYLVWPLGMLRCHIKPAACINIHLTPAEESTPPPLSTFGCLSSNQRDRNLSPLQPVRFTPPFPTCPTTTAVTVLPIIYFLIIVICLFRRQDICMCVSDVSYHCGGRPPLCNLLHRWWKCAALVFPRGEVLHPVSVSGLRASQESHCSGWRTNSPLQRYNTS